MITVVIPTYNEENTIKGLLDSLLCSESSSRGESKSELIVVDGGGLSAYIGAGSGEPGWSE